jgi:hypothetical protein
MGCVDSRSRSTVSELIREDIAIQLKALFTSRWKVPVTGWKVEKYPSTGEVWHDYDLHGKCHRFVVIDEGHWLRFTESAAHGFRCWGVEAPQATAVHREEHCPKIGPDR